MNDLKFTLICTLKLYKNKRKSLPDLMSGNYRPHILIKGDTEYFGVYFEQGEIKNFDEETICCLIPIYEGIDYSNLKEGTSFFIMEGCNKVGEGIVNEIFEHIKLKKIKHK